MEDSKVMLPSPNPRNIFFIDGIGALVSAISLGLVLTSFQHLIGMPIHILYYLSYAACVFSVYSFVCYHLLPRNWRLLLKVIATANSIYGCGTVLLLFYFYNQLLFWGKAYFILELMILAFLIRKEWKTSV
ncbi:hypothetical protein [Reichenbachiella faecimaris]|uniref:hypothetical protein n=1 Tax=Reichenbachiella faecimaris TaxID=692418 RepID=UPI00111C4A67|nr:hypothetical protein [Reichenbachiella faecimaris]